MLWRVGTYIILYNLFYGILFSYQVLVEDGELLSGIICKKSLGTSSGSLVHIVAMELGHDIAKTFMERFRLVLITGY